MLVKYPGLYDCHGKTQFVSVEDSDCIARDCFVLSYNRITKQWYCDGNCSLKTSSLVEPMECYICGRISQFWTPDKYGRPICWECVNK